MDSSRNAALTISEDAPFITAETWSNGIPEKVFWLPFIQATAAKAQAEWKATQEAHNPRHPWSTWVPGFWPGTGTEPGLLDYATFWAVRNNAIGREWKAGEETGTISMDFWSNLDMYTSLTSKRPGTAEAWHDDLPNIKELAQRGGITWLTETLEHGPEAVDHSLKQTELLRKVVASYLKTLMWKKPEELMPGRPKWNHLPTFGETDAPFTLANLPCPKPVEIWPLPEAAGSWALVSPELWTALGKPVAMTKNFPQGMVPPTVTEVSKDAVLVASGDLRRWLRIGLTPALGCNVGMPRHNRSIEGTSDSGNDTSQGDTDTDEEPMVVWSAEDCFRPSKAQRRRAGLTGGSRRGGQGPDTWVPNSFATAFTATTRTIEGLSEASLEIGLGNALTHNITGYRLAASRKVEQATWLEIDDRTSQATNGGPLRVNVRNNCPQAMVIKKNTYMGILLPMATTRYADRRSRLGGFEVAKRSRQGRPDGSL